MKKNNHNKHPHCDGNCRGLCCTIIENFSVAFGKKRILDNVNIHVHCGELTAIIGANGTGKTTLLKAILGEVKHSGKLKYLDAKGVRRGYPLIGYVPQYLNFDPSTPTSVFDLFMACMTNVPTWLVSPHDIRQRVSRSLELVKVGDLINRRLGTLSGGELQRVLLALALDPIPDILLLDEPVSGIDHKGLALFYELVSDLREIYDFSIIIVSHDLSMVEKYADRVILLDGTVVLNGTPNEVFNHDLSRRAFGTFISKQKSEARPAPVHEEGGIIC